MMGAYKPGGREGRKDEKNRSENGDFFTRKMSGIGPRERFRGKRRIKVHYGSLAWL